MTEIIPLYKQKLSILDEIPILYEKALHYVFEHGLVSQDGLWIEFGTYDGRSINKISRYTENTIYGFDSFVGLPEDWTGRGIPKGTFYLGGNNSNFSTTNFFTYPNVKLIDGWFKDTIPIFMEEHKNEPIIFIHIDSDIYSSCKEILKYTYANIKPGCIIVFDELLEYPGYEEHEWKAWWEFIEERNIEFEWIGGNKGNIIKDNGITPKFGQGTPSENCGLSDSKENVAVRILKNPHFKL